MNQAQSNFFRCPVISFENPVRLTLKFEKNGSEHRIYFEAPRSTQILPTPCDNCIGTSGVSISIRNLFDSEKIQFKLNIDNDDLPRPFPVFESWTKFKEDEYFD